MTIVGLSTRLSAWATRSAFFLLALASLAGLARTFGAAERGDTAIPTPQSQAIAVDQIGAVAGSQYKGDGLKVEPTPAGARLRSDFQKLNGDATRGGLWVTSTVPGEDARLRLMATGVGRGDRMTRLAGSGTVDRREGVVAFVRRGLTEEYSTSVDGVRQDFVLDRRPIGAGDLQVLLSLEGATATPNPQGATLTLQESKRALVYSRLHVADATGRALRASLDVRASDRLTITVDDQDAVYPIRIDPTFADADWVSLNAGVAGVLGPTNQNVVLAIAGDGTGAFYVGGTFTFAGDVAAVRIAKWDGSTWSALGSGMNATVTSLVFAGGTLYAGGSFSTAGGVSAKGVAQWDGNTWSALGSGVNGAVSSLAWSGSALYAGGSFTTAGGAAANRIAKWNGSTWSALGAGMPDGGVLALAADAAGNVYAGGSFTQVTGVVNTSRIAKWNGSVWTGLSTGMNANVFALAVDGGGVLYAGGFFTMAGGVSIGRAIAKWDGATWSGLGSGIQNPSAPITALAILGTDLYVGGQFSGVTNPAGASPANVSARNVVKWSIATNRWSALGAGTEINNASVAAVGVSGTDVFLGGTFTTVTDPSSNVAHVSNIAKWSTIASTWSTVGSGMNGLVRAVALMGTDLYIGGDFTAISSAPNSRYIAKWNGSAWSGLVGDANGKAGPPDSSVYALAVSGSTLYVGGTFTFGNTPAFYRIAKWTGTSWLAATGNSGFNNAVRALAVAPNGNLFIGGDFTTTAAGVSCSRVATIQFTSGATNALSCIGFGVNATVYALGGATNGTFYAGGSFTSPAGFVALCDLTACYSVGTGMNNAVFALASSGSTIYAGGSFTTAGGTTANRVAKWNGSAWSALGTGMNNAVNALAVNGADLYAGGDFTTAGGTGASRLAKWNSTAWSALGDGVGGTVRALAANGAGSVFVGGDFGMGGSTVSPFIVRADPIPNAAPVASAGSDQTVAATSPGGATVVLSGSASSDPDGDALTYSWTNDFDGTTLTGATPSKTVPLGPHVFTLTVTDTGGLTSTDTVLVTVNDVLTISGVTPPLVPATYTFGQAVPASYSCTSTAGLLASCTGTVANGSPINTASLGSHAFEVTATNTLGDSSTTSWTYNVAMASSTVAVTCPASVTYAGTAHTPCTAAASGAGMSPVDVSASLVYLNNITVGTATVSASWNGDANHTGSAGLGNFAITTKSLTATLTANSKVYDGTTAEPDASLSCALSGVVATDSANIVCTPSAGTFDSANVGNLRTVSATLTLSGSAVGNYTFGAPGTTTLTTVAVNAATSTTASAVYGQAGSFTTVTANTGGISADSIASARGVAADANGNIYVADRDNHRVLFFPFGQTTATRVYGQGGSFTSNTANNGGVSANSLDTPNRVTVDSTGLYVSDAGNARVLYFPGGSTTATRVYGQGGSFTSSGPNTGGISADSLGSTRAIAVDPAGNVYIADGGNHRILFYPAGSTTATRVYGQQGNFTANTANNGGVSADSLFAANGIRLDTAGNLYVADQNNHRLLVFPAGQTTATVVYGQGGNFTTNAVNNGGISAASLNNPANLALDGGNNVYLADSANNRVLFFPSGQTTATAVYGQAGSFLTNTINNGGVSADSLRAPNSVDLDFAGNIYVSDIGNNRLLRFNGSAPAITPAPLVVTASSPTKTYGTTASATPSYSGFVNGETTAVLSSLATCSSAGTAASAAAGTYTTTCSGVAGDNYSVSYVAGTLTVEQKAASVTPDAASKVYGSVDPPLIGTLSGFLAGDGVTATYSRTAGETVAGGPYTISATLSPAGVLGNYAITFNTANFTVTKANQVISVAAAPSDGVPDTAFSIATGTGFNARTTGAAVQADGKILVVGTFTTFDGVAANYIVRLNADGTRDASFSTGGSGFDHQVNSVALQSDGKIVVGGQFQNLNGIPAKYIARLNPNGTPDTTFITNTGTGLDQAVLVVAVQPDGKILAGGYFFRQQGVFSKEIARFNADGTADVAFRTNLAIAFDGCCIVRMAVQPDGKIVVIGDFYQFNLQSVKGIARINADGTPDMAFNANTGAGLFAGQNLAVALQADGRILLGGTFTKLNNVVVNGIARLNTDGTPDTAFTALGGSPLNAMALAVQPDGKVVAGSTAGKRLVRLNTDGTLDSGFDANLGTGLNNPPELIALAPDGTIILVDSFTSLNGFTANRIARLSAGSGVITKTYGDAPFTVSASASSGLPVSFSSTTPAVCTVAGGTVTIVGAGPCTIAADQAGDSNYHAAPTLNQNVTVNKAASVTSVTCPVSVTFDGSAQTPCTATTTGAGGFSESVPVTYAANTDAGTATANATYPGGANHNTSTGSATFAIAKASSTTTVSCTPSVTYTGTALQVCTATVTGAGGLNQAVTVSYANNTNVGTATANASFAGGANHDPSSGSATFTIQSAPLTATLVANSKVYDGTPAIANANMSCTLAGEAAADLPNIACTATAGSVDSADAGARTVTATVTISGTAVGNYTLGAVGTAVLSTSASAATTITKADATITVTGYSVTFDGAPHTATGTALGVLGEDLSALLHLGATTHTNAGDYLEDSWAFDGNTNYNVASGIVVNAIAKASSTTTVTCSPVTTVYSGAAQALCSATVTGVGGLSLTPAPVYTDNINVGTATASYAYAGDANHDVSDDSATFAITKASSTTTVTCSPVTTVYTGAAQELCSATVTGVGGLSLTPTLTYTNNTNVGTATASYSYAGDANHDVSDDSATFAITKATSTTMVTCSPVTTVYTGAAQELCAATATGAGGLTLTPVPTYVNNTNVGTATASYSYAGDANHDASNASATFAITTAALSVTANDHTRAALAPNPVFDGVLTGVLGADGITATYSAPAATLPGAYAITPALIDPNGKLGNYAVTSTNGTLTVVDADPPAVLAPAVPVVAEATSAAGAPVAFASQVSAVDAVFGPVPVTCLPASGSTFPIGTTLVQCTAIDGSGNLGAASFNVTVQDTTAPTLVAIDVTEVAANPAGVGVTFAPMGQDIVSSEVASTCSPTSGTVFTIGDHVVTCTAADEAGNVSETASFTVHVLDGVVPVVSVPAAMTVEATVATGATVTFAATASDNVDETLTVSCLPASGTVFPIGDTQVACTATDTGLNTVTATFIVTVRDTTAPVLQLPTVEPVVSMTPTTEVTYSVSASDVVDGSVAATCSPASGAQFPVGSTVVTCSTSDTQGNAAEESFTVRVTDGVSPVVTVIPAGDLTVEATSGAGAVVTFSATATDNFDSDLVTTCSPASGSTFPVGAAILVTCSATDLVGNIGRTTFTVMVVDTTAPVLTLPAPVTQMTTQFSGTAVTFSATAEDLVDGVVPVTCAPASGTTFAIGTTTVTCAVSDTRGNTSTGSFTVTVEVQANAIGRFVAFSRDNTRLRSQVTVVSGDVGANQAGADLHGHRREGDDDRDDVTVQFGERVKMQQATSRVVGDTVKLDSRASVYDVVTNNLINRRGTVLGVVTNPMAVPYLTLPVFPTVTAGTTAVTVKKKTTRVLAPGSYGVVKVENGATLILSGGLYQLLSLDVEQSGTVLLRGASQVLIKRELDTDSKARIVLDQSVAGLTASQMVFYVEGNDASCSHRRRDGDGDENGAASVHIGEQNVVQANIYAANGTVWLMSKTKATGSFIGVHVRIGQNVTLTLDSAFR